MAATAQRVPNPHDIRSGEWPFVWFAPSKSKPGRRRTVNLEARKCDCPAGIVGKVKCCHDRWTREYWPEMVIAVMQDMAKTQEGWQVLRYMEALAIKNGYVLPMENE